MWCKKDGNVKLDGLRFFCKKCLGKYIVYYEQMIEEIFVYICGHSPCGSVD